MIKPDDFVAKSQGANKEKRIIKKDSTVRGLGEHSQSRKGWFRSNFFCVLIILNLHL
jgi:hypothetical protein